MWLRETPRRTDLGLDYQGAAALGLAVLLALLAVTRIAGQLRAGGAGGALADSARPRPRAAAPSSPFMAFVWIKRRTRTRC